MRRVTVILFLSTCLAAGGMPTLAQEASTGPAAPSVMQFPDDPAPWPSTELERLEVWHRPITAGHDRFVVVGSRPRSDGREHRAAVWTSTDGLTWVEAPAVAALKGARMYAVAAFGDGFVAIGSEVSGRTGETGKNVVAWTSTDGLEWQKGTLERPGSKYPQAWAQDVVAGPAGLLAYGNFGGQDVLNQRLWRSADGLDWEVASFPEVPNVLFSSLTGFAGGYLLTGAGVCMEVEPLTGECPPGPSLPLWRSADGVTWEAIAGPTDGWASELAASDDGTVVAISHPPNDARIWVTSDLESWQSAWVRPAGSASGRAADRKKDGTQLVSVNWDGVQFVATGLVQSGEDSSGLILVSADGVTWGESNGPDGVPGPDLGTYLAGTATLDGITAGLGSADDRSVAWLADLVPTGDLAGSRAP